MGFIINFVMKSVHAVIEGSLPFGQILNHVISGFIELSDENRSIFLDNAPFIEGNLADSPSQESGVLQRDRRDDAQKRNRIGEIGAIGRATHSAFDDRNIGFLLIEISE